MRHTGPGSTDRRGQSELWERQNARGVLPGPDRDRGGRVGFGLRRGTLGMCSVTPPVARGEPRTIDDIAWRQWQAVDTASLTFVSRQNEVLLIRKKRGLGAGKISGPGGRLERGETLAECAVREVEEELCVTPLDPKARGELRFQFLDSYSIHVHVFVASAYRGRTQETDEAVPLWTPMDEIPYAEMWADDILWLPRVLAGETVSGYFLFDGDTMLDHRLDRTEPRQ